ncbi:methyltransferase domain-containing protein [Pseudonocardiaceae bacterium YIM PH 21723]|nr:methyltransferase domain-containing protein [Pseudonocardiaceae bacterium YIM PH 21723]
MSSLSPDQHSHALAARFLAQDDPTGWFEPLYAQAAAGEARLPWHRDEANPLLQEWIAGRSGAGKSAVVIGFGTGADAEHVASLGYRTTAFEISQTAVVTARERWTGSPVDYLRADLLDLPESWHHRFDLVVEILNVQALPLSLRAEATAGVRSLVAPGGTLVVICRIRADHDVEPDGPPWPLSRQEIEAFGEDLTLINLETVGDGGWWRAEFTR